jgi:signal transduction histidine kinase
MKNYTPPVSLQVLLVEDNQDDCLLVVDELRFGGFENIQYKQVMSADSLSEALVEQQWDIVLSDYNMPSFTGLEALKIVRDFDQDLPFVLISGAIGEELAVSALKAGATDYLLKDRLYRLNAVVDKELREAYRRRILREAQAQILVEKKNAEIANKRKSQVLAFVAHEFKNPINALILHTDLLKKEIAGPLNEQQSAFLSNIALGTEHLKDLVTDILDIAAIESGNVLINPEYIPIQSVLDKVLSVISPLADQNNIQLRVNIETERESIFADQRRLNQILINLLSNAIKYTDPNGDVVLKISFDSHQQSFQLDITDTGVGILPEEVPHLFDEYYRAYNLLTTQREGVGLGLAVTKQLVKLHNGTIEVMSERGQGTTFTVLLPDSSGH